MKWQIIRILFFFVLSTIFLSIAWNNIQERWADIKSEWNEEAWLEEMVIEKEKTEQAQAESVMAENEMPKVQPKKVKPLAKKSIKQISPSLNLVFPVRDKNDKSIISFFGDDRGKNRKHEGVDIIANRGTSVLAVVDGIVTKVGNKGNAGKQVWLLDEDSGFKYFYAHLDSYSVEKNEVVQAGKIIGTVGNTGNARHTSPHLHFEIIKNRKSIDPLPYLKSTP